MLDSGVLCLNNCGFYGTEGRKGYCSSCYQKRAFDQNISKFSTFEKKKKQHSEVKKIKNFLLSSSETSTPISVPFRVKHENYDLKKFDEIYRKHFDKYGIEVKSLIYVISKNFCLEAKKLSQKKSDDELSIPLNDLYKRVERTVYCDNTFNHIPIEHRNELIQFIEDISMTRLYNSIFPQFATKYEEEDLAIQKRIRSLNWINSQHLDSAINVTSLEVRQLVYLAITFLLTVDSLKTPNTKLEFIGKCSSQIRTMILKIQEAPIGADQFLPALIFVVLKANPVRPISNIKYIQKMCNESRVMKGENSYLFTSLLCAMSFIENISAKNLNISEFEFDAYLSGKLTPTSVWDSTLIACENMFQFDNTIDEVKDLTNVVTRIHDETATLKMNLASFKEDIEKQVMEIKLRTPLTVKKIRKISRNSLKDNKFIPNPPPEQSAKTSVSNNEVTNGDESTKIDHFYSKNLQLHLEKKKRKFDKDLKKVNKSDDYFHDISINSSQLNFHALDSISLLSADDTAQCSSNNVSLSDINYDLNLSNSNSCCSSDDKIDENVTENLTSRRTSVDSLNYLETFAKINEHKEDDGTSSIASTSSAVPKSQYIGFSRQGFRIQSIPCNIDENVLPNIMDSETDPES